MSKRKAKAPWLRLAASNGRAIIPRRGLAANIRPTETPIGRAMQAELGDNEILTDEAMIKMGVTGVVLTPDEKVIVKEVPAKVDGTVVGTAQIYEDGTVGVVIDENAPKWAKDKIKSTADELGYEIGEI